MSRRGPVVPVVVALLVGAVIGWIVGSAGRPPEESPPESRAFGAEPNAPDDTNGAAADVPASGNGSSAEQAGDAVAPAPIADSADLAGGVTDAHVEQWLADLAAGRDRPTGECALTVTVTDGVSPVPGAVVVVTPTRGRALREPFDPTTPQRDTLDADWLRRVVGWSVESRVRNRRLRTNTAGVAEATDLPAGRYIVSAQAQGILMASGSAAVAPDMPGNVAIVGRRMVPARIIVRYSDGRQPDAAIIEWSVQTPEFFGRSGAVRWTPAAPMVPVLPGGPMRLTAVDAADPAAGGSVSMTFAAGDGVEPTATITIEPRHRVDIQLVGPDGEPPAATGNLTLTVEPLDAPAAPGMPAGDDPRYLFRLHAGRIHAGRVPPGRYRLTLSHNTGVMIGTREIDTTRGDVTEVWRLPVHAVGEQLVVTARGSAGEPLTIGPESTQLMVATSVSRRSSGVALEPVAGTPGRYTLDLPPRPADGDVEVTLIVNHPELGGIVSEIEPGQRELLVQFESPATVTVIVEGAARIPESAGRTISVAARPTGMAALLSRHAPMPLVDGRATLGPFQPGIGLTVSATLRRGIGELTVGGASVEALESGTTTLRIELQPLVDVVIDAGAGHAGERVWSSSTPGNVQRSGEVGADGTVTLRDVPLGTHTIRRRLPDGTVESMAVTITGPGTIGFAPDPPGDS
jgi:hypothetical protein